MTKNPNLIYNRVKCQICGLPFKGGNHGRFVACPGKPQAVTLDSAFLVKPATPDESAQAEIYMNSIDPDRDKAAPPLEPHSVSVPVGASFA